MVKKFWDILHSKKEKIPAKVTDLLLLGHSCNDCFMNSINFDVYTKGSATSSGGIFACLKYNDRKHGVCIEWQNIEK